MTTDMRVVTVPEPGGPEALRITRAPRPTAAAGEVLIEVTAAGVNRADVMQRRGHYPPPKGVTDVLGLEVSGVIAGVGEGVTEWSVGDECVALLAGGGYAEFVAIDARQVIRPPAGMDLVTAGGFVEVAATVISNMDLAGLCAGETFLVHGGAGGIGSFAIQYAKSVGARAVTTAGREEKLAFCRELGADLAVSYQDAWVDRIAEFGGVDVILDSIGAAYLEPHVDLMRTDARMVVIGLQKGRRGEVDLGKLLGKRGTIMATGLRGRPVEQKEQILRRVTEVTRTGYVDGTFRPVPIREFALDDVEGAHEYFDSGEHQGKLVLRP